MKTCGCNTFATHLQHICNTFATTHVQNVQKLGRRLASTQEAGNDCCGSPQMFKSSWLQICHGKRVSVVWCGLEAEHQQTNEVSNASHASESAGQLYAHQRSSIRFPLGRSFTCRHSRFEQAWKRREADTDTERERESKTAIVCVRASIRLFTSVVFTCRSKYTGYTSYIMFVQLRRQLLIHLRSSCLLIAWKGSF